MKALVLALFALNSLSVSASVDIQACQKLASTSVLTQFAKNFVAKDGSQLRTIDSSECAVEKDSAEVKCEVLTNDGTGALDIFYNVVLHNNCQDVLSAEIYYIE
jgi:hypothetical protein